MSAKQHLNRPLYQHVAASLRQDITRGAHRPGDRLPSESELCARFGVSRITVRAALDLLASEGLLSRRQGSGTFVSNAPIPHDLIRLTDFVEDMAAAGLCPTSQVLHFASEPVDEAPAHELGLPRGTSVIRLDRLRLADEQPVAFDTTYFPLRYGRLLDPERLASETIYRQLEEVYGIPIISGDFVIAASAASAALASQLAVEPGAPLLVIRRTSYGAQREPIYYQERSYRADRVLYRVELMRDPLSAQSRLIGIAPVFTP